MPFYATARRLVAARKFLHEHPDGLIKNGDWARPYWTADEFNDWFSACLAAKINSNDRRFPKGRKASYDYELELMRLRNYIGNRIVIDFVHPVLGIRVKQALMHRMRHTLE